MQLEKLQIHFDSRRKSEKTLQRAYPGATFIDVTSRGDIPWRQLSPFFPHGGIPVPFSPGVTAESVEGIWQGLKVFAGADVDGTKFGVRNMKGIKRTVRKNGRVLGHRRGVDGDQVLPYVAARRVIYLPSYRFVLENRAQQVLDAIRERLAKAPVVLLDYETNGDLEDTTKPLSHASLVVAHLNNDWPSEEAAL